MEKDSFQKMAEESQQEFRKQFDPASESYHKGLQQPVPLNGSRIPESMPSMYPQQFDPNQASEEIDYGEEYRKVEANRAVYQNLKKSLAKLCPVVQSFLRHEETFKLKGDSSNEKHIQIHQDNIQKQQLTLKAVNTELEAYLPVLEEMGEEGQATAKELKGIIEDSKKKYSNKQELANFNFKAKKLSTQTFALAQKCLQRLKDIKKEYAAKKKLQAVQVESQPKVETNEKQE